MEIIGGAATKGRVALYSADYIATARLNKKDGSITSEVRPRRAFQKFFGRHPYLPPKSLIFSLVLLGNLKAKEILTAVALAAAILFALEYYLLGQADPQEAAATIKTAEPVLQALRPLLFLPLLLIYRSVAGGFHAAEHMATAAHLRHGADGLEHLAEQSRINPRCIGRFLMPGVILSLLIYVATPWLGPIVPLLAFAAAESMFWIDMLVGLQNIFVTAKASELLQRYLTTKPPTPEELRVGREALRCLLVAHGEL